MAIEIHGDWTVLTEIHFGYRIYMKLTNSFRLSWLWVCYRNSKVKTTPVMATPGSIYPSRSPKKTIVVFRSTATCWNRLQASHYIAYRWGEAQLVMGIFGSGNLEMMVFLCNWWDFLGKWWEFMQFYAMFVDKKTTLWKPLTGDFGWMFVGTSLASLASPAFSPSFLRSSVV